jgi:hypothetical protein
VLSEAVNQRTDNNLAKIKKTKGETIFAFNMAENGNQKSNSCKCFWNRETTSITKHQMDY